LNSVRLMTWNIHGALGRNPRFDLDLVVGLVQRHAPDVIALQEIDSRRARAAHIDDPFNVLQDALGNHGVGAKTVVTADGEYGQALISRWPLVDTEIRDLSYPEREPRRAICTRIETPYGPLRVVATHLGLSLRERRSQAAALLEMLGGADATTTAALGDFNDWMWAGSVRRVLASALPAYTRLRTFPSACPLFQLDRIYLWPRSALLGSWTDPAARMLSDHLPVIGEIRVQ
jgi:endonuclease/exonuclease/phosphatase family metal-dependent hydrolase